MESYRRAGMAGCKFKVGGLTPEDDARRVEAARRAAGSDFVLAVDANCAWSVDDAVRFARLVEPFDIAWFEEPCHWYDDAAMMARVRAATRIPVTAGQSEITSHGVRRLLDAGVVDLVNVDASECGGVTEWRRAAALAQAAGVRMAPTRNRRSPSTCWPAYRTGPTSSASPIPSATRSGRRCGATARRRRTGCSSYRQDRASGSCSTTR
jgi:L-alanine-DL-glutamate epimerase-like enolase superfamily enzyme